MADVQSFEEKEFSESMDFGVWKRIFGFAKPLRVAIVGLILLMILVAIIDGILPQLTRYAIDTLLPSVRNSGAGELLGFGLLYLGIAVVQGFNVWALIALAGYIEVKMTYTLRKAAFQRLQELSFSYYDRTPSGWILARMNSDTNRLGEVIAWGIVDLVWGSAFIVAMIAFMFAMNWQLALIALVILPPLLVVSRWFQKRILEAQRKARKTSSELTGLLSEGIQGSRTSKTLVLEDNQTEEFRSKSASLRDHALRSARYSGLYLPLVIMLATSSAALALGAGGTWVIEGVLSIGTLVAFLSYTMQFFDPAREVARVLSELQAAQASAERLISLIETKAEIVDRPEVIERYGSAWNPKTENWESIKGEIEFSAVDFSYNEKARVFEGFNLKIPAGQTLAVVGETGSGKSSLVNLLCRFYEPQRGHILIDGKDYRERSQHWLHSRLGYVLQSAHLFSGTIAENIRYGRLDANDLDIIEAARQANALDFINKLEQGFDTRVGEGGVLLSTGEKQLVSLARALVANPSIMILDEATSSIDTEAERLIQDAVERMLKGRTSVVIAHRLSTIRNADRIVVMHEGTILEDGSHEELMAQRGYYHRLYTRQFLDEESLSIAG